MLIPWSVIKTTLNFLMFPGHFSSKMSFQLDLRNFQQHKIVLIVCCLFQGKRPNKNNNNLLLNFDLAQVFFRFRQVAGCICPFGIIWAPYMPHGGPGCGVACGGTIGGPLIGAPPGPGATNPPGPGGPGGTPGTPVPKGGSQELGRTPLKLVGGFNPFEKYARQNGNLPQIRMKIKNI